MGFWFLDQKYGKFIRVGRFQMFEDDGDVEQVVGREPAE